MNNYIYTNKNSLSPEICKLIINNFENEKYKYEGITSGGLNKEVKDTTDFNIPQNNDNDFKYKDWPKIYKLLEKELSRNLKIYVSKLDNYINENHQLENSNKLYKCFNTSFLTNNGFMIQKYKKNNGRYIYHDDFQVNWEQKKFRVITFLWYLNSVEDGGETEFWCNYDIKPEAGKLLLFPSSWAFPHRGKIPISSEKYIITGWMYYPE